MSQNLSSAAVVIGALRVNRFSCNIIPYFCRKFEKVSQNLSSAAVVIGALRVNCATSQNTNKVMPGRVAQSVTCLATDACLTADPGVASSIPVRSHTFVEIDHEMISTVILLLPLIHSRRVVVSYKRKYVHELLVNRLFKSAQEKVWLGELTVPQ